MQCEEIYGRMRPKTIPIFVCFPHWSNSGRRSRRYLDILEIMLYGDMKRGEVWSIERGGWRCSVITESIGMDDYETAEIIPDMARYSYKEC